LAQQNSSGTTDTVMKNSIEPIALETVEFVLETAQRYLVKKTHRPMCFLFCRVDHWQPDVEKALKKFHEDIK
jgi:hypothetical protein